MIADLPGFRPADVVVEAELPGLTNRSFRLRRGDETFVLRLPAEHTAALGIDRDLEIEAGRRAFRAGMGAEPVYADTDRGILLTRYVAGQRLTAADLNRRATLENLAALLRRVHAIEPLGRAFDAAAAARRYAAQLPADAGLERAARRAVDVIDSIDPGAGGVFCHNDVVAHNVVDAGTLRLLDWEYAADNDPLFDVAVPVSYHELAAAPADALLVAYLGSADAAARERLQDLVRLHDALHWLWLALRQSIQPDERQASRLERLAAQIAGQTH